MAIFNSYVSLPEGKWFPKCPRPAEIPFVVDASDTGRSESHAKAGCIVHTEGTTLLAVEWWHNGGTMYNIIDVLFLLVGLINDNLITEPTQPGFPNVFLKWPYVFLL